MIVGGCFSFCRVSGQLAGGAWVPGRPRPGFCFCFCHDSVRAPVVNSRTFHLFHLQNGHRPNSRAMHRFSFSHLRSMNEQDQVT